MTEITILSGKGGTGKTSVTAALASLAKSAVFCDNDVDAADLHLIFEPQIRTENTFAGAYVAQINDALCTRCGICHKHCRFDAIHYKTSGGLEINPFQCEGCRLCERVCPANAINTIRNENNFWYISDTRFGTLVHAKMAPGEENSGKLVTKVRQAAAKIAKENKLDFVVNDGPPGIGCSAISSITGTNRVLIVIEPTKSGLHDAERLIELIRKFDIKTYALINKFDINLEMTQEVETYLQEQKIELITKLPFDKIMVEAMINKQNIVEFAPESEITLKLKKVWEVISRN